MIFNIRNVLNWPLNQWPRFRGGGWNESIVMKAVSTDWTDVLSREERESARDLLLEPFKYWIIFWHSFSYFFRLIEVLRDFGRTDWQLAAMVCMILCNYTEKMKNSPETLGEQEASSLTDLLVDYLGKTTHIISFLRFNRPLCLIQSSSKYSLGSNISELWGLSQTTSLLQ